MRVSPFQRLSLRTWLLAVLLFVAVVCIISIKVPSDGHGDDFVDEVEAIRMQPESMAEYSGVPAIPDHSAQHSAEPMNTQSPAQRIAVEMPSFDELLPHLRKSPGALQPSLIYPNDSMRPDIRIVIGVPTVARDKQSYLLPTLQSLAFGLSAAQQQNTLIVIMIGSLEGGDTTAVREQISLIEADFQEYLSSGLFRVIVPPRDWYPEDLNSLEPNLGDSPQRMFWRTKQNLDYMFLMLYCRKLGEYYLQVEDDVLAKSDYMAKIESVITEKGHGKWFTVDFASLGFIGKLFHAKDLVYLIHYIALLYRYRPVDWILDTVFIDRYCPPFEKPKNCSKMWKNYRLVSVTLFQHVGVHSSLGGKVQKLREKNFGQSNTFNAHTDNPPAIVTTNLEQYIHFGVQELYDGHSLFWSSSSPVEGSFILIEFVVVTKVKGLLIRSGNAEHPDDKLDSSSVILYQGTQTEDKFVELTAFNERGVARYEFDEPRSLRSLRIEMRANYSNWLLISELHIRR
ncbi:unnamed protein product [Toxocara canis]|uniref:Alpha-1,3-mannosyl-glycoprotein 4-beta-N-acetylglucosaminyltransferase A n=1 Tax=Toxocara canis TaxID=6265 RepID=A0A183ULJ6_TOXCA|nr:unnamed protein product [Toxocara canis]